MKFGLIEVCILISLSLSWMIVYYIICLASYLWAFPLALMYVDFISHTFDFMCPTPGKYDNPCCLYSLNSLFTFRIHIRDLSVSGKICKSNEPEDGGGGLQSLFLQLLNLGSVWELRYCINSFSDSTLACAGGSPVLVFVSLVCYSCCFAAGCCLQKTVLAVMWSSEYPCLCWVV